MCSALRLAEFTAQPRESRCPAPCEVSHGGGFCTDRPRAEIYPLVSGPRSGTRRGAIR